MTPITQTFPIFFALATTFGVLMHDTQIDKATTVAIVNPIASTNYAAAEVSKSNDHVHVEKVSVYHQEVGASKSNVPKIPPRDDNHRFMQSKKSISNGGDSPSLWPSV